MMMMMFLFHSLVCSLTSSSVSHEVTQVLSPSEYNV